MTKKIIMENIREITSQLTSIADDEKHVSEKIEKSFQVLKLYYILTNPTSSDIKDCCYAAVRLAGAVQKGLGDRVVNFLNTYEDRLPRRAITVLRSNLVRMQGY